jgi:hypothetical protein
MVNQDFRDLFAEFNARHVDFLVVGAYALAVHGHVRATKDLDGKCSASFPGPAGIRCTDG